MKNCLTSVFVVLASMLVSGSVVAAEPLARLKVSEDGHSLVTADGRPFFWLGDTAWQLILKASRKDVAEQPSVLRYFEKRAAQGFNVIQTVLVWPESPTNSAGYAPFENGDFARPRVLPGPEDDYWDDVDRFVDQAAQNGLYMAMLPVWSNSLPEDAPMVKRPEIAYRYGHFLGSRYAGRSNVIWVLGGDSRPSRNAGDPERLAMMRAMAEGLADGTNGADNFDGQADWSTTLITFHPPGSGESSSRYLHDEPWLDMNMIQTTTRFKFDNYASVLNDYFMRPPKPTLDAEVAYEDSLTLRKDEPQDRRIAPWDVRRAAYWAVLAGACGHTYGHRSFILWLRKGETKMWGAHIPWYESLDAAGARQMQYLRELVMSLPPGVRVPDGSMLLSDAGAGDAHIQALRGADSDYLVAYSPMGQPITVRMGRLAGERTAALWFDPRTGQMQSIGEFKCKGTQRFDPPGNGRDNDWVLVLKKAS